MLLLLRDANNNLKMFQCFWGHFSDLKKKDTIFLMLTDAEHKIRDTFYLEISNDMAKLIVQMKLDLMIEHQHQFNDKLGKFCNDNFLLQMIEKIEQSKIINSFLEI